MPYPAAAQFLRTAIPDIVRSYQSALRAVRSPLATRKEAWPKCRDQAQAIVEDCVTALMGEQPSPPAEARRYSHLVGVDRATQGIAVAESVRAVDILWSAMQPAVRSAVSCEATARRTAALLVISTAFRASSGSRLYAGAVGYDAAPPPLPEEPAEEEARSDASGETPVQSAACAGLSQRERQVLERVARAMTNSQIARDLGIETATVKRHLNNIYAKLQAESRIDAINKAYGRR
ncbi:helix-turn-helix transcriptional regulator [Streptomyces sp. NPDC046942]|uniref:helix-turn-helix transcriptional regulator n=1 Tax=Streptomyces sp. NPDC046942 TaxID=3155137 RepID=UPI0033FE0262